MAMKLTERQKEVVAELRQRYGNDTFVPVEAYPYRNAHDNGGRRVIWALDRKEYFERVDITPDEMDRGHIITRDRRYRLRLPA